MIPSNTNNNNVVRTERARNVRDYRFGAPAHTENVFSTLELATCKIVEALGPIQHGIHRRFEVQGKC